MTSSKPSLLMSCVEARLQACCLYKYRSRYVSILFGKHLREGNRINGVFMKYTKGVGKKKAFQNWRYELQSSAARSSGCGLAFCFSGGDLLSSKQRLHFRQADRRAVSDVVRSFQHNPLTPTTCTNKGSPFLQKTVAAVLVSYRVVVEENFLYCFRLRICSEVYLCT